MKKLTAIVIVLLLFSSASQAQTVPLGMFASGPFQYMLDKGNGVIVTAYTGKEEDIVIPDSLDGRAVTQIGDKAFLKCDFILTLKLPNGLEKIGDRVFANCRKLREITLPPSLESIGPWAFVGCDSLVSVQIPPSVSAIGDAAFSACKSLSAILTQDGNPIFESLDGVLMDKVLRKLVAYPTAKEEKSYEVPQGTESIGARAFVDCDKLESVTFPSSLLTLGTAAFSGCGNLVRADLPEGLREIGTAAFNWCEKLVSSSIPSSVTAIFPLAFTNCASIFSFQVAAENAFFDAPGGALYDTVNAALIAWPPASNVKAYAIPEGTKAVNQAAFMNCIALQEVTLPDSVISIGQDAFRNCEGLTSLYVPPSVVDIGPEAFIVWGGGFILKVKEGSPVLAYAQANSLTYEIVP